jgi:hypothetical protein
MKSLNARLVAGLLIGVSAVCSAANPLIPSLHASGILTDVRTRGAKAVVASLWSDGGRWNQVMANIGRGRPEWLEVAVALQPGTDAGAAETLDEAVFFALGAAPVAVLKLLKEGRFQTKFVCSSNVEEDYTTSESQGFIRERIKVLSGLADARTLATRDQCLAGLRSALADLDSSK